MEPENPLLLPRAVWQIALVVTLILVAVRAGLYVRDRRRAAALEAQQAADAELTSGEESATLDPEPKLQEAAEGA